MIKFPPNPFVIKDGFFSAFQFMSKKGNSSQLFNLNLNGFWDSCWIVFFVNAVVSTLASYGIKANIDGDIQSGILPRLLIITIIDICLFSILVNTIFEKIGKGDKFFKFIIPFNWIQSFQAILMLSFAVLGLILPPSIFVFFGIMVVIWVTFSLWRIGKEEVGLTEGNIFQGELTFDQLLFNRPIPGYAKYRSPIRGLYMCGSSTHPGGGVMGAPGRNAAIEILKDLNLSNSDIREAYEVL